MDNHKCNISNKKVAGTGAIAAVAAVFAYSLVVIIYTIIRSSITIVNIMPVGQRTTILFINGFSIAYSAAVFSLIMATGSTLAGTVSAIILKNLLQNFNGKFNIMKAFFISCITAFTLLILLYKLLYALMKDWMTFNHTGTFLFWFLFPAGIFFTVCIIGGSKLNKTLKTGIINRPKA